ncbi:hypothetical protein AGOR_G00080330 [Albula goreensis]|uniref:Uncharacterized protein n=1 Tax=Albula goreensis TaxID=1534307 RepID=A0A8T3DLZ8_9TELE|nr:hypothetical protein AGOR_G00080330 [Albula goreensis]
MPERSQYVDTAAATSWFCDARPLCQHTPSDCSVATVTRSTPVMSYSQSSASERPESEYKLTQTPLLITFTQEKVP